MHRGFGVGTIHGPGFVGGETDSGREPLQDRVAQNVHGGERGLALHRRRRIAVQHVLADVEVERRQFGVHEVRQRRDHRLVVEVRVGWANDGIDLGQAMQHQPFQLRISL